MAPLNSNELLAGNIKYIPKHIPPPKFNPEELANASKPKMLIISCIDLRVNPEEIFHLKTGEVPVLRNAGGRASGAVIDTAVLDTLVDLSEVVVVHHTDCALGITTNDRIRDNLRKRAPNATIVEGLDFGCYTDLEESVKEDVLFLRAHPLIRETTTISGMIYDIESGKVSKIEV